MAAAARCHAQVTGQAGKGAIHRANGFGVERKDEAAGIGSDTYVFNRGDGTDTIEDNGRWDDADRLTISGYAPADVTVSRPSSDSTDAVLTFSGTTDQITIRNTLGGSAEDTVERIEFDDDNTTVWTMTCARAC